MDRLPPRSSFGWARDRLSRDQWSQAGLSRPDWAAGGWASASSQPRLYQALFSRALVKVDAETAHRASITALATATTPTRVAALLGRAVAPPDPVLSTTVFGRTAASPLGLAAGFDKNAHAVDGLGALGFGAVEIGTVTGQPQPGNPVPRLFRLPADHAIVNRMGFNNDGSAGVAARLAARQAKRDQAAARRGVAGPEPLLGVNIGKTKVVEPDQAAADYDLSARRLVPFADYLVVNVSSPNTPGLRDLQAVESLRPILVAVRAAMDEATPPEHRRVPLLVKIAPDLADDDVRAVADLSLELGLDGIVATNTTISREGLSTPAEEVTALGAGGLSGPVLAARSMEVLRLLRARVGHSLTLVSVGGVSTGHDVYERLAAGANLVQAYTGLIYGGPRWPMIVNAVLAQRIRNSGLAGVDDLVGRDA